jgi:hypothetical protein
VVLVALAWCSLLVVAQESPTSKPDTLLVFKNGAEVRGTFMGLRDGQYTLRLADGRTMSYPAADVDRMERVADPAASAAPAAAPPESAVPPSEGQAVSTSREASAGSAGADAPAQLAAPTPAPGSKRKVLMVKVADGTTRGGAIGVGSGGALAAALTDALVSRGLSPFVSDRSSIADGIREAKEMSYEYVLRATITEWEDNATAWSGNPDSAAVSLELYDLAATLVSSATHRKKGSSFSMSSKSPDRFLPELVQTTVSKVFGPQKPAK